MRRYSKFISTEIIDLKSNLSLVKTFPTKFYNTLKVNIAPSMGRVLCDLRYCFKSKSDKITQCKWYSDSQNPETHIFMNEPMSDYYELVITPENDTKVSYLIENSDSARTITPYNSIIAPKDSKWARSIEIVPEGSTYLVGEKSTVVDFGTSEATNLEIISQCSDSTLPKISIFGSMENVLSKFTRITEISMNAGTATPVNDKYYSNVVALTHQRYFYIQIENAQANDLYINLIRRNY